MHKSLFPYKLQKRAVFLEKSRLYWAFLAIFSAAVPMRLCAVSVTRPPCMTRFGPGGFNARAIAGGAYGRPLDGIGDLLPAPADAPPVAPAHRPRRLPSIAGRRAPVCVSGERIRIRAIQLGPGWPGAAAPISGRFQIAFSVQKNSHKRLGHKRLMNSKFFVKKRS